MGQVTSVGYDPEYEAKKKNAIAELEAIAAKHGFNLYELLGFEANVQGYRPTEDTSENPICANWNRPRESRE